MNKTNIEWTDYTWNPVTGCNHNCKYCYARRLAARGMGRYKHTGFTPTFHPDRLNGPDKVKVPSKIFVGSMGDIGGEWYWKTWDRSEFRGPGMVWLDILDTIERNPHHTFQILTKNPKYMAHIILETKKETCRTLPGNVWIGTSIANQEDADKRIPSLLQINAAVRFVSIEPMLGPVVLQNESIYRYQSEVSGLYYKNKQAAGDCIKHPGTDWVIVGAQTGPGAVKPNHKWVDSVINQCRGAGVPIFIKDNVEMKDAPQEIPLSTQCENQPEIHTEGED